MDDHDLDARIRAGAPHVSSPVGLAEHRARILREARVRPGRRLRLAVVSVVASVVLVGTGSAAMAGFGVPTPWGWIADNASEATQVDGTVCFQGLRIEHDDTVSADSAIVHDARAFLASIDVETLDTSAKEAELEAREARGEIPASTDSARQLDAVLDTVSVQLWAHLDALGYPDSKTHGSPISVYSQSDACGR